MKKACIVTISIIVLAFIAGCNDTYSTPVAPEQNHEKERTSSDAIDDVKLNAPTDNDADGEDAADDNKGGKNDVSPDDGKWREVFRILL